MFLPLQPELILGRCELGLFVVEISIFPFWMIVYIFPRFKRATE